MNRQMRPAVGQEITLDIERPAAGGRMLARHGGQMVFVAGAIPGELVRARITRVARGVVFADVSGVLRASDDRRTPAGDPLCGGHVFAHVRPSRQIRLKGEIIEDAFRRLAKHPLPATPSVEPSPEAGYRMRSRFHVQGHRIGFLREGTHQLCSVKETGQLHPDSEAWVERAAQWLGHRRTHGVTSIDMTEDLTGAARACHLDLAAGEDPLSYRELGASLVGLSAQAVGQTEATVVTAPPVVVDRVRVGDATLTLARDARAFFQGNRYLLEPLVAHVVGVVPQGAVLDLYAGVGVFGLALAAAGRTRVTLVEGDPISGQALVDNAVPFGSGIQAYRMSVEQYLAAVGASAVYETVVVDPPRTGLSSEALSAVVTLRPGRLVYVSCDVATLGRDARLLFEAGYVLEDVRGFDLFPNTAHIETVAVFVAP